MSRRHSFRADWLRGNVKILRAQYENACRVAPLGPHAWRRIAAGDRSIRVLVHGDLDGAKCAIFYFHGGSWIVGSPSTHAGITGDLHIHAGLPVISIDYRLAPENRIDAAMDDGMVVLAHFLASGIERAILCGDSAGASLAMAVERHAPSILRAHIAGVCSLYGAFRAAGSRSILAGSRSDGLDQACLRRYWLLANGSRGVGPFSIPALLRADGCPIYLLAGGSDPVHDDSIDLARELRKTGRNVTLDIARHAGHGFLHRSHPDKTRDDAFARLSRWIRGVNAPL